MSDLKSKLPSLKELGSMTSKLLKDLKNSVSEIIEDYKQNHPDTPTADDKETVVKEEIITTEETVKVNSKGNVVKEKKEKSEVKEAEMVEPKPGKPADDDIRKD